MIFLLGSLPGQPYGGQWGGHASLHWHPPGTEFVVGLDDPDSGSDNDDKDWASTATVWPSIIPPAETDLDIVLVESDFWLTKTRLLDFRYTLFISVEFFLSGVGNHSAFMTVGTKISPSEAVTSSAAIRSFSSLSIAAAFFDTLLRLVGSCKPERGVLYMVEWL